MVRSMYLGFGKQFLVTSQGLFLSNDASETYFKIDLGTRTSITSMIMIDAQKWVIATSSSGPLATYDGGS